MVVWSEVNTAHEVICSVSHNHASRANLTDYRRIITVHKTFIEAYGHGLAHYIRSIGPICIDQEPSLAVRSLLVHPFVNGLKLFNDCISHRSRHVGIYKLDASLVYESCFSSFFIFDGSRTKAGNPFSIHYGVFLINPGEVCFVA